MSKETKKFQTEVKEILDLMIHSLYTHKEVFLRELISNASDAIDRLRYEALTQPDWKLDADERHIRITGDKENNTLTIRDNGIGMTFEEVTNNIGTIAHSGSKSFLSKIQEMKDKPELIGQFGVGFYSGFMVADKVVLETQKAGSDELITWESAGDGEYTIDKTTADPGHGTTITLHLKELAENEENPQNFSEEWAIKSVVKKYSDFVQYPIKMKISREEFVKDSEGKATEQKETIVTDDTLNSQKAIWLQNPKELTDKDYNEFYKHISHDWTDPLKSIHFKVEGTQEFSSLLYIPSQKPMDFNYRDFVYGLNLYVNRVFIMDNCEELVPPFLRFMKGVVDSSDLSLNVSREFLQKDHQAQVIRKSLTNKILSQLKDYIDKDRVNYEKFWDLFGATLKEGIPSEQGYKDKLQDLLLFKSTDSDKWSRLSEYVERMPKEQKAIYYLLGDQYSQLTKSPVLEGIKSKGFEVLLLTDPVDEWVMTSIDKYKDLEVISATSDKLELDSEEEKLKKQEALKDLTEKYKPLTRSIQSALDEKIKEVKLSDRLTDSPVCLVNDEDGPTARMEQLMKSMGQSVPKSKRVLEINPKHALFEKMLLLKEGDRKDWAEILYDQALLNEGSPLEDPLKFSQSVAKLMASHGRS